MEQQNEPKGMSFVEGEPTIVTETRRKILKGGEHLEFYDEEYQFPTIDLLKKYDFDSIPYTVREVHRRSCCMRGCV